MNTQTPLPSHFSFTSKKTIRKFPNLVFLQSFQAYHPKIINLIFSLLCRFSLPKKKTRWIPQQSGMWKWGHSTCMQSIFTDCNLQCELRSNLVWEHTMYTAARRQRREWVLLCMQTICYITHFFIIAKRL